jgi:hypothetical protein
MKTASSRFAGALFSLLKNRRPLIVASTDLTHYPPYEAAVRIDKSVLSAVAALDLPKLTKTIEAHMNEGVPHLSTCMCGLSPVMTTMALVKDFGVSCGRIISYANSGDAAFSGRDRVVGYGAVSFAPGGSCEPASKPEKTQSRAGGETTDTPVYTKAEKRALISLARKSIRQFLESETAPLPRGFEGPLAQKRGAFVTLKKRGRLRGCIGHMVADTPLGRVVCGMALQAAFNDRRFPPLSLREFDDILIEISVLTPFQKVDGVEDIVLGRDGILLKKNGRSAVYLPQVATEQGWSLSETLSHLSRKAGLSAGAWKSGAHFYTFRAIVFDERDLG